MLFRRATRDVRLCRVLTAQSCRTPIPIPEYEEAACERAWISKPDTNNDLRDGAYIVNYSLVQI